MTDMEIVLRLVLAAVLGSLIGVERERLQWTAGLRTHMLVSVGSCLCMIVSAYGFNAVLSAHVVLDPSRVAAQVVSGVGFLGAGSIILRNEAVKGLTTAASLWAVAAVGLAVGGGRYVAAFAATVIILVILVGVKPLGERLRGQREAVALSLTVQRGAVAAGLLKQALGWRAERVRQVVVQSDESSDTEQVALTLAAQPPRDVEEMIRLLSQAPGVGSVRKDEHRL